ncbi:MAG: hypothetical protein ACFB0E_20735 [Leptolyngbyaceae cyanobacterium]
MVRFSCFLSVLGICLILYDRIFIQGIDYTAGIASAREQWRVLGEQRQGISSLASFLGNILSPFCFIPTALIHLHYEKLKGKDKYIGLSVGITNLFLICLLSGGRSSLLLQISITISICLMRNISSKLPFFPGSKNLRLIIPSVLFILVLIYSTYIFFSRAAISDVTAKVYSLGFIEYLGGRETQSFHQIEYLDEPLKSITYLSTVTLAYLVHSLWTFGILLDSIIFSPGSFSFVYLKSLLAKLSLATAPEAVLDELQGRFLPLPGILWYDIRYFFVIASIIHGFCLGLANVMVVRLRLDGLKFAFIISVFSITFLSPFCFAINLYAFPFVMFSCIFMHSVMILLGRKIYWL